MPSNPGMGGMMLVRLHDMCQLIDGLYTPLPPAGPALRGIGGMLHVIESKYCRMASAQCSKIEKWRGFMNHYSNQILQKKMVYMLLYSKYVVRSFKNFKIM